MVNTMVYYRDIVTCIVVNLMGVLNSDSTYEIPFVSMRLFKSYVSRYVFRAFGH